MITQYWHTVRHLELTQVVSRLRLRAAARARASFPMATRAVYARRIDDAALTWRDDLLGLRKHVDVARRRGVVPPETLVATAERMAVGTFDFINETGVLGWPPDWSAPAKSRLWRFHLHYFDDLPDVALLANPPSAAINSLIDHWIHSNPLDGNGSTADAWHPYVVSLRLVNWMLYLSATAVADGLAPHVRRSLVQHAIFLERNLETDLGGNHLLKNLKALVFAGCFWAGGRADRWRDRFAAQFVKELGSQVLADGGHFERSPMYHAQVLCDAIEVAAILRRHSSVHYDGLSQLLHRMDRFAASVTHPDGNVALFNDCAFGVAPSSSVLHCALTRLDGGDAGPVTPRLELLLAPVKADRPVASPAAQEQAAGVDDQRRAATATGYVAVPRDRATRFLIADVGAGGPDNLPGHAHSDLLSYELSIDKLRVVVDSGVGEYAAGRWRDYYRSTRAHNTVLVDATEQSDCWGSFRVGRRASPAQVVFTDGHGWQSLEAEHTGYDHLGVRHRRRFLWSDHDFWIVGDTLVGDGHHTWSSFCHLHPEAVVIQQTTSQVRVARDRAVVDICWFGPVEALLVRGHHDPLQGWFAERFGPAAPSTVLVLEGRGTLPVRFGYALIARGGVDDAPAIVSVSDGGSVEVANRGRAAVVDLTLPTPIVSVS